MHPYYHKQSGKTYYYYKTISLVQLKKKIDRNHNILILDLLDDEFFDDKHIPTAQNACVYEVEFLNKVKKLVDEKKPKKIIIYGMGGKTYETKEAYFKLINGGFDNVYMFKGGLIEREKSGMSLEGNQNRDKIWKEKFQSMQNKIFEIDTDKSRLERTGSNILRKHIGTIDISDGFIEIKNGDIVGGEITLDMNTIQDIDLQDKMRNDILVNHLKSADFFEVKKFPQANFKITYSKQMKMKNEYYIHGKIKIKSIEKFIRIKANLNFLETGEVNLKSIFEINKIDFDIFYGSPKFFAALGKHFVHDKIGIEINLFGK